MGQHVIAEEQIGLLAFGDQFARSFAIEKFHQRGDALLNGNGGDVGCRLHTEDGNLLPDEILQ